MKERIRIDSIQLELNHRFSYSIASKQKMNTNQ